METHGFAILHALIYSKSHSKLLGATAKVLIRVGTRAHPAACFEFGYMAPARHNTNHSITAPRVSLPP